MATGCECYDDLMQTFVLYFMFFCECKNLKYVKKAIDFMK